MRTSRALLVFLFCCLPVALVFTGCPQNKKKPLPSGTKHSSSDLKKFEIMPGKTLLRWFPKSTDLLLVVPNLEKLSLQLNEFLKELNKFNESASAQLRSYIGGLQGTLLFHPLERKSLYKAGIQGNGAMVLGRATVAGSKVALLTLDLKYPAVFEKYLQAMARQRFQVQSFRTSSTGKTKVVGAYRPTGTGQQIEELTYAIDGNQLLLTLPLQPQQPVAPRTNTKLTPGEKVLMHLLRQKYSSLLASSKEFNKALGKMTRGAMFSLFRKQPNTRKAGQIKWKGRANLSQGLSAARLAMQRVKWMNFSATANFKGVKLTSFFRTPSELIRPFGALLNPSAKTTTLHQSIHSKNVALATVPLKAENLEALLKRFGVPMKQAREQLKKLTGVELDSLLKQASGEVVLALNDVDPNLMKRWSRNLMVLPAYLGYTIAARIKEPKKLSAQLDTIAKNLKIFGNTVQTQSLKSGAKEYSIPLWPGTTAYWTIHKDLFLYSLGRGRRGMQQMLDALDKEFHRVFRKGRESVLANSTSIGLRLELNPFRATFMKMQLPFTIKLAAGNFLTLLQGVDALEVSLKPQADGIDADIHLLLERFKKKTKAAKTKDSANTKKTPQPAQKKSKTDSKPGQKSKSWKQFRVKKASQIRRPFPSGATGGTAPSPPPRRPAQKPKEIKKHPSNQPR